MAGQKLFQNLPIDSNIAAGNLVTVKLPVGKTVEGVMLELTDLAKTEISDIRLSINSRLVSEFRDVAELELIDSYYEHLVEANKVFIRFSDETFDTIAQQNSLALGTVGLDTVDITFKIAGTIAGVAPAIKASAIKSKGFPTGTLRKVRRYPVSVPAGEFEFSQVRLPEGARIKAIHCIKAEDDMSHLELEVDKSLYVEMPKSVLQSIQKQYGRNPQATMYSLDFALQGDLFETFKIAPKFVKGENGQLIQNPNYVQDFRLRMNCATAGQVYIVVEYIDAWSPTGF